MKKSLLIVITLVSASIANLNAQYVQDIVTGERLTIKRYTGIQGTPYFDEDFTTGDVYLTSGEVFTDALIRYNAYENEIEYSHEGRLYSLKNHLIREFHMRYRRGGLTDTVIFRKGYSGEGLDSETFYIVHYEGDITFIERFSQRFQEELVPGYGQPSPEKRFTPSSRLFLIREDESVDEIRKRKNSVLNALTETSFFGRFTDEKRRGLNQIIRQKNLDMGETKDIALLLEYYDKNY